MFGNYFKTTYRHLLKSKVNFAFKLGGLTIALLSFLVITIYVSFQLSFDRYHHDYKDIYRINSNRDEGGQIKQYAMVPPAIGPALKAEFPDVKSMTRVSEATRAVIQYQDKLLRSHGFVEADSSLFNVLTFEFIEGNGHALNRPGTIVLTESLAKQIFGDENAIGKLISFPDRNNKVAEVTAVIGDLPRNTHLTINAILPFEGNSDSWEPAWDGSVYLFVRLNKDVDQNFFSEKINPLIKTNIPKSEDGREKRFSVFLQPVSEIYLGPDMTMHFFKKGDSLYVYIFSLLAFFLFVIASINYSNLSIVDFQNRSKEIGVRKILGAKKKQIAFHMAMEAVFLCFAGLFISLAILYLLFPVVLQLFDPNLHFSMLFEGRILLLVVLGVFLLAALSTAYPALRLSRNRAIGYFQKGSGFGRNMAFGRVLLLFQFIVSIICISATFIVGNQVEYIRIKDLGYDRHNVVSLIMPEEYPLEKAPVLKSELNKLSGVVSTSYAYYHITGVPYFKGEYEVEVEGAMKTVMLGEVFVDHDYFETMKIKILTGRNFDIANPADFNNAFIVNETAVKEFGWENPVGKRIRLKQDEGDIEKWEGTVIAVAQDFNTRPLHERIEPVVMRLPFDAWPGYCLNVRLTNKNENMVDLLKSTFEKVLPGYLADPRVVEEMYDRQYDEENRASNALQIGTWIIVLISALGIFSLSAYLSVGRMKEFGIRKVLGATVGQIAILHVGDFMRIVFIAHPIALPVAWWLMKEWLKEFAYRTEFTWMVFVSVVIISFLLVILSAGYSSWKAGRRNPVDVIKSQN